MDSDNHAPVAYKRVHSFAAWVQLKKQQTKQINEPNQAIVKRNVTKEGYACWMSRFINEKKGTTPFMTEA